MHYIQAQTTVFLLPISSLSPLYHYTHKIYSMFSVAMCIMDYDISLIDQYPETQMSQMCKIPIKEMYKWNCT